jgi:glycosyltransferase involved in cell wall biosynthesis
MFDLKTNPKLSLCMIVKNEEDYIGNCLKSLCDIVDEMVIVDTGSTDKTKEICLSFNANVYDYQWNESFANARNFGLEKATGDWILWLDADEELVTMDKNLLHDQLYSNVIDVLLVQHINYYGSYPPNDNNVYTFFNNRIFRNHIGIKFIGRIHEYLDIKSVERPITTETTTEIKILHYGYLDELVECKRKSERNLRILESAKLTTDYSPWIDYHISSELYRLKEYDKALKQVNISILRFLEKGLLPPSLLYKLKYDILLVADSAESALPGLEKAILLYPDYVDLHFYKGLIFLAKMQYENAILVFEHCLILGENNVKYLTLKGVGSFLALYYIGICNEALKDYVKAENAYTQALYLCPNHIDAHKKLVNLKNHGLKEVC